MTTDRTQPPPDDLMCKVVAKWKGWKKGVKYRHALHIQHRSGTFHNTATDEAQIPALDPRTDTDAALELLGWLWKRHLNYLHTVEGGKCTLYYDMGSRYGELVIQGGIAFRTTVCWLAVDVLGVSYD